MIIKKHKKFVKGYLKLSSKIQSKVDDRILVFYNDRRNPILLIHALTWRHTWNYSFDVIWDIRIIFRNLWNDRYEIIELIDIWTHSQLY